MIQKINSFFHNADHDFKEILTHSFFAFLMLGIAGGAQILFDLILARKLGANGYGMFYLAYYVIFMLSLFGRLGINKAVVKYIPPFRQKKEWAKISGLKKTADHITLFLSIIIAFFGYLLSPTIANSWFHNPALTVYLQWFMIALPALSFLYVQTGFLSGLKLVKESVFIERASVNIFAIIIMLCFGGILGVNSAVIGTVVGIFIFAYIGSLLIKRFLPRSAEVVSFDKKKLLLLAAPLFLVDFSNQMIGQINALILGGHASAAEVGIFNAALRLSAVISVVLTGINAIATTKIAEVHHQGNTKKLGLLASKTAALALLCGLPVILAFIIWPQVFLGFFGQEFTSGSIALRLLVIGQAVNLGCGSVVQILSMTGYHKEVAYGTFGTAFVLNLILTLILSPVYGINGAAIAVCISLVAQNILLLLMTKHYVKIWSLPFGAIKKWLGGSNPA